MQSAYSASKMHIAKRAFRFVFAIGIVSLFADVTYEGARGITGPFLGSLGANAAVLGLVVGFGELLFGKEIRGIQPKTDLSDVALCGVGKLTTGNRQPRAEGTRHSPFDAP